MIRIKNYKEAEKVLRDNGYYLKRNTQGSHKIFSNGQDDVPIPFTSKNPMLFRRIFKEHNIVVR